MKKLALMFLTTIFLITNFCFPISAEGTSTNNIVETAKLTAVNYLAAVNSNDAIICDDGIPIYDFNDEAIGGFFNFTNTSGVNSGYAFVASVDGILEVIEASVEDPFAYSLNHERIYYGGPLQYFYKSAGDYYSIVGNQKIIVDNNYITAPVNLYASRSQIMTRALPYETLILSGTITKLDQHNNPNSWNSTCVATSLAMIMHYWKDNHFSDILTNGSTTYTGNTLADKIASKIGYSSVDFPKVDSGMPNLMSSTLGNKYSFAMTYYRSLNNNHTLTDGKISVVTSEIFYNRPLLVMVGADGYRYDSDNILKNTSTLHGLMVIGYRYSNTGGQHYLVCVDPWNKNTVDIKWDTANGDRKYFALYGLGKISFS